MTERTAIVTGATGYVGSRLAARLQSEGWEVHVIARPESDLMLLGNSAGDLAVHRYDGSIENLIEIVRKAKPDIVFHLASVFMSEHQPQHIERMFSANILFGTQLAEAMTRCGVLSLVNTGTSWQHYGNRGYNPVCLYAATKQAMECMLTYYVEAASLNVITLKLFDTYGPGDPRQKLFSLLQKAAREQEPLEMSGGEQLIDLVYIDDVVDAYILAAARLLTGQSRGCQQYAVSSGKPVPLRKLVEQVELAMGKPIPVKWGARPYRTREVMTTWSGGEPLPGWHPGTLLTEGLRMMGLAPQE